jgi:hypothetical protein
MERLCGTSRLKQKVPYVFDDENCLASAVKIALSSMALRGCGGLGAEPPAFEIIELDVEKIECK